MDNKFKCRKDKIQKAKDKVGFSANLGGFNWKCSFSNFSSHLYGVYLGEISIGIRLCAHVHVSAIDLSVCLLV